MKLNHENTGAFSLLQKLSIISYYSDISPKSVLEDVEGVADTYYQDKLNEQDIFAVFGDMFQRQQMTAVLDHLTFVIGRYYIELPIKCSLANEKHLLNELIGKFKCADDIESASIMIRKCFPAEWKQCHEISMTKETQDEIKDEIDSALLLYLNNKVG